MRRCGQLAGNCVYKIGRIVTRVDLDTIDHHFVRVSLCGLTEGRVADAALQSTCLRLPSRAAA